MSIVNLGVIKVDQNELPTRAIFEEAEAGNLCRIEQEHPFQDKTSVVTLTRDAALRFAGEVAMIEKSSLVSWEELKRLEEEAET